MIIKWKSPIILLTALWRVIKQKFHGDIVILPPHMIDIRLEACSMCYRNYDGQCLECACFISIKSLLKTEKCPIGRWPET